MVLPHNSGRDHGLPVMSAWLQASSCGCGDRLGPVCHSARQHYAVATGAGRLCQAGYLAPLQLGCYLF
jgi:hypothetical protein